MKRRTIVPILLLVLFVFASCAGMQMGGADDSPQLKQEKAYLAARKEFALTLKKYNDYYDRANAATQAKWKEQIDPLFKKTDKALKAWKLAIDQDFDATSQEQFYLDMKGELFMLLVDVFVEEGG